jgi:uncharacterized membrane protein YdbT with pleckstrin-like domain
MPDQTILQAKPSMLPILVIYPTATILLVCPFLYIAITLFEGVDLIAGAMIIIGLLALAAAVMYIGLELLHREFTTYTLTETHLLIETGIMRRQQEKIPMAQIEGARIVWPIIDQVFGLGQITANTATATIQLRSIANPKQWEEAIYQRLLAR